MRTPLYEKDTKSNPNNPMETSEVNSFWSDYSSFVEYSSPVPAATDVSGISADEWFRFRVELT